MANPGHSGLKIAIFGQAPFGREVTERLSADGHEIVGVHAPPDAGRPDPLAALAEEQGWPLFRYKGYRRKGQAIAERVAEYLELGAELNVLPFTTVILPPEIVDAPVHGSLCFHPSALPAYRGGSAIPWQIIEGVQQTAATVFKPDAGVDTGPIVVQKGGIEIPADATAASLYFDALYPAGVEAMVEAVGQVAAGTARFTPQSEAGASFQPLLADEHARIDWRRSASELDRLARGCDPNPGAWAERSDGSALRVFGARVESAATTDQAPGTVLGFEDGRLRIAASGGVLSFAKLRIGSGKKAPAADAAAEAGLGAGEQLR